MRENVKIYEEEGRKVVRGLGAFDIAIPEEITNFKSLIKYSKEKYGEKTAFLYKRNRKAVRKSYIDFAKDVDCLGTALCTNDLKNKKIAIISENRYEWSLAYMAVTAGTGVVVPLDKHLPEGEIVNLVERSGCEAVFFSKNYLEIMKKIEETNSHLKQYICFDDVEIDKNSKIKTLAMCMERGEKRLKEGNTTFLKSNISPEDTSILLFTSGTTKRSKGVLLSQKNILSNLFACSALIGVKNNDVHLSLLPLHHTFENTIGFLFMLYSGVCVSYSEGIKHISDNLKEFKVSALVAVPAIFETLYNRIWAEIKKSGKVNMVNRLLKLSEFFLKCHIDLRRLIMSPVRNKISPNLRLMASGAAPMRKDIIEFFEDLGISFIQGYGLTETSPLICATVPGKNIAGSVGFPVRDVEITIDSPDSDGIGEIFTRGENVTKGYFDSLNETQEAFSKDGWFRTGDLGVIDDSGSLKITGREKSMIVLYNGKKAFPEEFEELINSLNDVKESFVWGQKSADNDVQICAEIVLKDDSKKENVLAEIKKINEGVPKYKIIRYVLFSHEELIKTTTLKVKRSVEEKKIQSFLNDNDLEIRRAHGMWLE